MPYSRALTEDQAFSEQESNPSFFLPEEEKKNEGSQEAGAVSSQRAAFLKLSVVQEDACIRVSFAAYCAGGTPEVPLLQSNSCSASAMPYHSKYNQAEGAPLLCGMALLPIQTSIRGPAPAPNPGQTDDIIQESIDFFRANVLVREFDVEGPADKVLMYLTLYISKCLAKCATISSRQEASRAMYQLAVENFTIPGDRSFPLGPYVSAPESRNEGETIRQYFRQLREETGTRLLDRVFKDNQPNKWWLCFRKRKFMNKTL